MINRRDFVIAVLAEMPARIGAYRKECCEPFMVGGRVVVPVYYDSGDDKFWAAIAATEEDLGGAASAERLAAIKAAEVLAQVPQYSTLAAA
jgi:hypothetical protein